LVSSWASAAAAAAAARFLLEEELSELLLGFLLSVSDILKRVCGVAKRVSSTLMHSSVFLRDTTAKIVRVNKTIPEVNDKTVEKRLHLHQTV